MSDEARGFIFGLVLLSAGIVMAVWVYFQVTT